MSFVTDTNNEHVKSLIEQLYESSDLTDALTDENAKILLGWGEGELKSLPNLADDQDELESVARQLRRVMRSINRIIEQKAELSDTKMLQRLLRVVEQSMQLAMQKSIAKIDV